MVGGIGVAGIDPGAAEFATVAATFGTEFFVALPLPEPQRSTSTASVCRT